MPSEHPSQSYLDESKLQSVIGWFDFDSPNDDPLPVRDIGGKWTLTDGHTRAFTAYLSRAEKRRFVRDTGEVSIPVYEQCVSWCREENVTEIADFAGASSRNRRSRRSG